MYASAQYIAIISWCVSFNFKQDFG